MPAVPVPGAHCAHCTGLWRPAPRKSPKSQGLPSLGDTAAGQSPQWQQDGIPSFLGNPKAAWLSLQEWEGDTGDKVFTNAAWFSSFRADGPPSRPSSPP